MDSAHRQHSDFLITSFGSAWDRLGATSSLGDDTDRAESPFAARDRIRIVSGPDVTLSDEARDEVGGDYAALRMGSKEDGVGATEIIDPGGIGEIRLVQPGISMEHEVALRQRSRHSPVYS